MLMIFYNFKRINLISPPVHYGCVIHVVYRYALCVGEHSITLRKNFKFLKILNFFVVAKSQNSIVCQKKKKEKLLIQ